MAGAENIDVLVYDFEIVSLLSELENGTVRPGATPRNPAISRAPRVRVGACPGSGPGHYHATRDIKSAPCQSRGMPRVRAGAPPRNPARKQ